MISKNQLKFLQSLHQKKFRHVHGLFIAEGIKLVNEFLESAEYRPTEIYATETYLQEHETLLQTPGLKVSGVTEEELRKISLQSNPNQVLAVCPIREHALDLALLRDHTTLYLDGIRDPGNLGTILRIADWFGIRQVICSPDTTELYNPKTIQAAMGASLRVHCPYLAFDALLETMREQQISLPVYAALLQGENLYTSTLQKGILVIGNEANGISEAVSHQVSHPLTIPAAPENGSESLNAAIATAVFCSEFMRQLRFSIN